jgi:hypothetical protein
MAISQLPNRILCKPVLAQSLTKNEIFYREMAFLHSLNKRCVPQVACKITALIVVMGVGYRIGLP